MAKTLIIGSNAREKAVDALCDIADAVATTLGPTGLPAIIDQRSVTGDLYPTTTKDGVSTINAMGFVDPVYNAVWTFAKAAATHSVIDSGDGTTSTVVLAAAIARMIMENKSQTPQLYARHISNIIDKCASYIAQSAVKAPELVPHVAKTSSNGDEEIANVTMEAIQHASGFGTIIIEKNVLSRERYKVVRQEGYHAGRGYRWHPTLACSVSQSAGANAPFTMKNPYILLYNGELQSMNQLEPAIRALASANQNKGFNLVCFGYDAWEELGHKLIEQINTKYPNIKVMVVKTRQSAEVGAGLQTLLDVSAITGAKVLDGGSYESVTVEQLGVCQAIDFSTSQTVIKGRCPNHTVVQRIQENLNGAQYARSDVDKDMILARNAELAEGLVQIIVGGGHMASIQERSDRLDDAIKAAQAAKRSGVVPGCGVSYFKSAIAVGAPYEVINALRCVYNSILMNYGIDNNDIIYDLADGYTCKISESGLEYGNFMDLGVVDAADTVLSVLRNGTELGIMCATTGCAILTQDLAKMADMKMLANMAQGKDAF